MVRVARPVSMSPVMTDASAVPAGTAPTDQPPVAPGGLYLVDGSGFIFRAFHALPPLNRPDGTPVNAVLGFTNMLMKLLADLKAEARSEERRVGKECRVRRSREA